MKYQHIAVFIRGHKRIWDYVKDNIFYSYDQIADNVDYYVSVWETFDLDLDKMKNDFEGRNLIAITTGPLIEHFMDPWKSQAWLPYNLLPYKKIRERQVTYDAVFDQRFDVALAKYRSDDDSSTAVLESLPHFVPFVLEKNKFYSTSWPVVNFDPKGTPDRPHAKDYCFMAHSETFDLLCTRFACHWDRVDNLEHFFAKWLYRNRIEAVFVKLFQTMLCRPDICAAVSFPLIEIDADKDLDTYNRLSNSFEIWRALPKEEKIKLCSQYHIDLEDYLDNLQWN
jgi:hypothetical protein